MFTFVNNVLTLWMLIVAAFAVLTATTVPTSPKVSATATARATIIEAARIDFNTAVVRVRKDQIRSIDFE